MELACERKETQEFVQALKEVHKEEKEKNIAKERRVIPDPIDDRKFQE